MRRNVARHGNTLGLDEARVVKLFSQGLTQTVIAERMGCSGHSIGAILKRHNEVKAAVSSKEEANHGGLLQ